MMIMTPRLLKFDVGVAARKAVWAYSMVLVAVQLSTHIIYREIYSKRVKARLEWFVMTGSTSQEMSAYRDAQMQLHKSRDCLLVDGTP